MIRDLYQNLFANQPEGQVALSHGLYVLRHEAVVFLAFTMPLIPHYYSCNTIHFIGIGKFAFSGIFIIKLCHAYQ